MVFVGWILPAADPKARIQTQVAYLEGDFRKRGWQWGSKTGKGNAANTEWIIQWFMLWATEVPSYWEPWETSVNIPQNYPNWGRENCGICPQGPTCQCWRAALPGAVTSSAHLPASQWFRGSRPVGWESPQPWLQLEAVSWHAWEHMGTGTSTSDYSEALIFRSDSITLYHRVQTRG